MARISKVPWSCRSRFCKLLAEVAAIRKRTCSRNQHDVDEEGRHPDDDDGDFGYRETGCLSSYYSVFVARLAIMVMLAILIGLLTFLTWHFTMVYTKKSIQSLAYNLRYELLQRPISRMSTILNTTVEITNAQVWLAEYVVKHYPVPQSPNEDNQIYEVMKEITWAIFVSRKALNAITVSYNNGRVEAFHRDRMNTGTYYIFSQPMSSTSTNNSVVLYSNDVISNASLYDWVSTSTVQNNSFIWYREPVDPATGKAIGPAITVPSDDLMNITGISTIEDEDASWQVTVSKFTDSPLLASKSPVRDPANSNIVAVVGVRTALSSVGRLMKELVEMHGGYMFLVSHEGYLLATSTDTPLMMNTSSGLKLITASECTNTIISAGARWLQEYADASYLYNDVHVENVMLGNHRYYIDTFRLNLTQPAVDFSPLTKLRFDSWSMLNQNFTWEESVGVIIIPRSFVMGKVDRQSHAALIILVSASICILVIGCFCILILTSGVSKEMKLRAELISHLDARRRAEASSNYKSQFLANMSHELRTPMAAVIGLLDILLCDNYLSTEQIDMLSQIRRCSTALLRLLNDILDLSKVESGKLVLEEAEFDIGHELEALIDMFSVQCVDQNIDIILDLDDNIPKLVLGDSARVVQIFANLINNSIKFTSSGCIILRGWCGNSPINKPTDEGFRNSHRLKMFKMMSSSHPEQQSKMQEKLVVWFEVEDTGCGIDQSKWESVFESFVQADLSTTRTYGGTGLGLCIVRSLVQQMKGHISIKPKSGPGTLIQLSLEFGIPPQSLQQFSQHTLSRFMKENPLVLLALTDSISGITISQWLQQNGIQSIQASDWKEITDNLSRNLDNCLDACSRKIVSECQTNHKLDSMGLPFPGDKASVKHSRCSPDLENLNYFVVIDAKFVESHTDIWKCRLSYLNKYQGRAKFAWLLNHDTSTTLKLELRRMGHNIMVNKPLYKSKLIQILENMMEDVAAQEGPVTVHSKVPILLSEEEEKQGRISTEISSRGVSLLSSKSDMEVTMSSVDFDLTYKNPNQLCAENLRKERHYDSHHTLEGDNALQLSQSMRMSEYLDCNDGTEQNYRSSGTCYEYGRQNHLNDTVNSALSLACHGCRNDFVGNTKQSSHRTTKFTGTHSNNSNVELPLALEHRSKFSETQPISAGPLTTPCSDISITFNSDDNLSSREQISSCQSIKIDKNIPHAEDPYIVAKHELRSSAVQNTPSNAIFKDKSLQGIHILLAEDTPVLQKVAMIVLQKMGATVVAVGDGLQAVNALKSSLNFQAMDKSTPEGSTEKDGDDVMTSNMVPFDLILMDCQMPKMDGYEATEAIRTAEEGTDQHIPIIALTAHAMSSDEAKCLEVGMDAYLTKPIDYALMTSTILSLVRKRK